MDDAPPTASRTFSAASPTQTGRYALILSAALLVTAALMLWHPWIPRPSLPERTDVDPHFTNPATVRKVPPHLLFTDEDGEQQRCSECHEDHDGLLGDNADPTHTVGEPHEKVVLHHGKNNRCFNCHQKDRRDYFSDYAGNPIEVRGPDGKRDLAKEVLQLCPKCHGPHYRDWLNGSHGRRSGYWDTSKGARQAQPCIACHDPHWPRFKPLAPAPGPQTLHAPARPDHE